MKRATLTAYPTVPAAQPADLTDRLLASNDGQGAGPAASTKKRRQTKPTPESPRTQSAPAEANSLAAANNLAVALAAADAATQALRQASHTAPARYDVALRYRLDALAHHLQQVKDFVANRATQ